MDATAVRLADADLSQGSLNVESFARPMKPFTASVDLIARRVAIVNADAFRAVVTVIIESLQKNLPA
jgi:hypothetical protein